MQSLSDDEDDQLQLGSANLVSSVDVGAGGEQVITGLKVTAVNNNVGLSHFQCQMQLKIRIFKVG